MKKAPLVEAMLKRAGQTTRLTPSPFVGRGSPCSTSTSMIGLVHPMMKKMLALSGAMVVASSLFLASPASAEANGVEQTQATRLRLGGPYHGADSTPSDCGSIAWKDVGTNGDDSPIDSNDRALVAEVCDGDFAEAYTRRSLRDRDLDTLKNVSFDYKTSTITGAGQVYIFLYLKDGTVLYLDPAHCSKPISSTWSRADFTGETDAGDCTIYDSAGTAYTSDGTRSALEVFSDANPDAVVSITDLVFSGFDDPSHTYIVDRIALGTNRLFNYSNLLAVNCKNLEARC